MVSRATAVRVGVGSSRLEGMEPTPDMQRLLDAWAAGDVSDEQLKQVIEQMVAMGDASAAITELPGMPAA